MSGGPIATPLPTPSAERVSGRAWFTLAIASTAAFMVALEVTIISLALPEIQDAFAGVATATLSWVFTAYSIGVASLLLLSGWAADLFGRKRLFLCGMVVFAVGSLGSGAAQSVTWLIAASRDAMAAVAADADETAMPEMPRSDADTVPMVKATAT